MKRLTAIWAVLAMLGLSACAGAPKAPAPTAGDCTIIRLWSNGFHTNIALSADILEEGHPLRDLFPEARYFLIGWGERDFYMAMDAGFWKGLDAIVPPSPSVMQIIAAETPVEETLWPGRDLVDVAISGTGARQLADGLARALKTDEAGRPVVLGEGRVAPAGLFVAARPGFHLFYMCNHWTAARLREAGVAVTPGLSFTAASLMRAVRTKTPRSCPAP